MVELSRNTTPTPLIQLQEVNKYYPGGDTPLHVLKNVTLTVNPGEFISIMGPSGSGKSTLINILGFLDNKFEGHYTFEGESVERRTDKQISNLRNRMVGFVFQSFNLIESMTVEENIRLPLLYNGMSARATKARVQEMLDKVGLSNMGKRKPYELSGGQKQRVAIARSLVNHPKFIIADEPTGALDTKTSKLIMAILKKLHEEEGVTIVMVTHDPTLQQYATRHIAIVDGEIVNNEVLDAVSLTSQYNETMISQEEKAYAETLHNTMAQDELGGV